MKKTFLILLMFVSVAKAQMMAIATPLVIDDKAFQYVNYNGRLFANYKMATTIDRFVRDLRGDNNASYSTSNIFTKGYFGYPMVNDGVLNTREEQCSINLFANGSNTLTYAGSPIINADGIDLNGTTQYANTNWNPSSAGINNTDGITFMYATKTTTSLLPSGYDMGVVNDSLTATNLTMIIKRPTTTAFQGINALPSGTNYNQVDGSASFSTVPAKGLHVVTQKDSITWEANNVKVATNSSVTGTNASLSVRPVFLGARNVTASAGLIQYGDHQCMGAFAFKALTRQERTNFFNAFMALRDVVGTSIR